jgi:hypothetical protein
MQELISFGFFLKCFEDISEEAWKISSKYFKKNPKEMNSCNTPTRSCVYFDSFHILGMITCIWIYGK